MLIVGWMAPGGGDDAGAMVQSKHGNGSGGLDA